jgi:hypothetical protein
MPNPLSRIRILWNRNRSTVLALSLGILTVFALLKLGSEFYRLVWDWNWLGAIDLKMRHQEVHAWFAGTSVYHKVSMATYPPASYVILWPFLGWLAFAPARWFWACTTIIAIVWLAHLVVDQSKAGTRPEQTLAVLIILSMNATGVTIGNGQLTLHLLPVLIAGVILTTRKPGTWPHDLLGAALVLAGLVKPNITVPFFWIVLFVPGRLRPALLVVCGYVVLTLFAASFQQADIIQLIRNWVDCSVKHTSGAGYADLHILLNRLGLEKWSLKASLLVLAGHGLWVFRQRRTDIWLLLGVTAIIARIWTYHGLYDDVLILLPMVALFRMATHKLPADADSMIAGLLLAVNGLTMLAPARMHHFWPQPWPLLFAAMHIITWAVTLIFLLYSICRLKK